MKLVDVLEMIANDHQKPINHVAINWVNQQPGITTSLVGMKTPEQAISNAEAGNWELSKEELMLINSTYEKLFGDQQ